MPPAIPIATYRLQLSADFDFDAAAAVVPYLKTLGITHLYASPFMKARKGSTHGYDIIDHAQFNPELGGETGFERLSAVLKQYDLGLILDFVPNHVGVHFADNPWWLDVLEWGPASPHAVSFDIDWDQLPYRARGGVLLPIIGSSYGQALEHGVKVTGVTVHLVTRELDGGPIVVQRTVAVLDGDTRDSLAARVLEQEHLAYPEAVAIILGRRWTIVGRRFVRL